VRDVQVGPSRVAVGAGRDKVLACDREGLDCRQPVALVEGQLPERRVCNPGHPVIGGIADADEQIGDELSSLSDEGDGNGCGDPQCGELVAAGVRPVHRRPQRDGVGDD
jgi:hypothetical protein